MSAKGKELDFASSTGKKYILCIYSSKEAGKIPSSNLS